MLTFRILVTVCVHQLQGATAVAVRIGGKLAPLFDDFDLGTHFSKESWDAGPGALFRWHKANADRNRPKIKLKANQRMAIPKL